MKQFRLPSDDLEYDILTKLWDLGMGSVRELHELLGQREGLVYTTTAKVVDRLRVTRATLQPITPDPR